MAKGGREARRGLSLALGDTRAARLSHRYLEDGDDTESAAGNFGVA